MSKDKITLHLVLKKKWWDMIDSGVKTEEYREITHHWMARLFMPGDYECIWKPYRNEKMEGVLIRMLKKEVYETFEVKFRHFETVVFQHGYSKDAPRMEFEIETISVGKGKPEWGAPQEDVFIIKLGKRV